MRRPAALTALLMLCAACRNSTPPSLASTTLSAQLHDAVDVALTAQCPTPENARRFEESLRAIVTLAAAASARQPDIATVLQAIRIHRDDRTVHAKVIATPEALAKLAN